MQHFMLEVSFTSKRYSHQYKSVHEVSYLDIIFFRLFIIVPKQLLWNLKYIKCFIYIFLYFFCSFLEGSVVDHRSVTLRAVKQRYSDDRFHRVAEIEVCVNSNFCSNSFFFFLKWQKSAQVDKFLKEEYSSFYLRRCNVVLTNIRLHYNYINIKIKQNRSS